MFTVYYLRFRISGDPELSELQKSGISESIQLGIFENYVNPELAKSGISEIKEISNF